MLDEKGAQYRYREYTEEPLSLSELKTLVKKLSRTPADVLRKRDAKAVGLTGAESDAQLVAAMARHPTLLQRPILVSGKRAVVGRPVENLLELV